jgi:PncC family amidohydrolase
MTFPWTTGIEFSAFSKKSSMYDEKLVQRVGNALLKRHHTIAVAESVTSGHLQAALSLADRAMDFFQGGITDYNLGQKSRHLGIDPIHALSCNCVSLRTAAQMALGACNLFSSDWGIGITGYAAPVPELNIKSLFAFYAIAFQGKIIQSRKITAPVITPVEVQLQYANVVVKNLATAINKKR